MKKAKIVIYSLAIVFFASAATVLQMGGTTISSFDGQTVDNGLGLAILGLALVGLPLIALGAASAELARKKVAA